MSTHSLLLKSGILSCAPDVHVHEVAFLAMFEEKLGRLVIDIKTSLLGGAWIAWSLSCSIPGPFCAIVWKMISQGSGLFL